MNRANTSGEVWYGGVIRARLYDPQGRHRPDIAAWITEGGWLIGAKAVPPGQGARVLSQLLHDALKQRRITRPRELALESLTLLDTIRSQTDLPLRQGPHWGFALVLEDNLHAIGGLGFEQGYVE
ncbi:MAG TPA: hypothetical protein VHZ95_12870, partial [Polyangiales bacterium]|nr:hypothetical protein [Polyangiales bacterium]